MKPPTLDDTATSATSNGYIPPIIPTSTVEITTTTATTSDGTQETMTTILPVGFSDSTDSIL